MLDKTQCSAAKTSAEKGENVDHRFYFEPSAGANITVSNLNTDDNGVPLALHSTCGHHQLATGTMTVTLKHYGNDGKAAVDLVASMKSYTIYQFSLI